MSTASISIVVPTKNAARTLRVCLESIVRQSVRCSHVVAYRGSVNDSTAIASGYADLVLDAAPSPSLQRNVGARTLPADVVGFVDADMVAGEHVVEQVAAGAGSVVVPGRSFGQGYWAKVRTFKRSKYLGTSEGPRFFSYDLFEALAGYDEDLEDTDLGPRAEVGRTPDVFLRDEGRWTVRAAYRKNDRFATGISAFRRKHGIPALASHLRHPNSLLAQPTVGHADRALKGGEAAATAGRLLLGRWPSR